MLEPKLVPLSEIMRLPRNPKRHDLDMIHGSVRRFGFLERVIVNRITGRLIAGHGRVDMLQRQKDAGEDAPTGIEVAGGEWLVPSDYVDVPAELEEAASIALNRGTEIGGWDDRALAEILRDINDSTEEGLAGTGYDEQMLAALVYVTRPASEIADSDEAAEWVGMPDYGGAPDDIKLVVHFRSEEDKSEFADKLGIDVTDKTKSVWWPPKEKDDVVSVRFVG